MEACALIAPGGNGSVLETDQEQEQKSAVNFCALIQSKTLQYY